MLVHCHSTSLAHSITDKVQISFSFVMVLCLVASAPLHCSQFPESCCFRLFACLIAFITLLFLFILLSKRCVNVLGGCMHA